MQALSFRRNFNVRRSHCYSPDEGTSQELNGVPRGRSNEQYQPIVLPDKFRSLSILCREDRVTSYRRPVVAVE